MSKCISRMSFLLLFILSSTFLRVSEAIHDQKRLPSAVIVGTVYCDTCFQQEFSKTSHFISGASVAVECKDGGDSSQNFYKEEETSEKGEFKVHLPVKMTKSVEKIKACSVKLLHSNEPFCAVASTAPSSTPLQLQGRKEGTHVFSAGAFTFKPLKQPKSCNQKPTLFPKIPSASMKISVPLPGIPGIPNPIPVSASVPVIPQIPVPIPVTLPPLLPNLPHLPLPPLPVPKTQQEDPKSTPLSKEGGGEGTPSSSKSFLFPTPPIFPSPPPSIGGIPLPPNPLQPPPLLPPIPGLITPPPPASIFPPLIPPGFPGIPGIPIPGFPGRPPSSSSSASSSSP